MDATPTTSPTPAFCAACGSPRSTGARFCHRCGTPAGVAGSGSGAASTSLATMLPWGVAAIALIALVALLAGQFFGSRDTAPTMAAGPISVPTGTAGPAPDISSMSPQERADRLFYRVMTYSSEGRADSATFFAPMALGAFEAITPRTLHHRYDMGLIGLVTGDGALAAAQADTILRVSATHLLGLALAARAADAQRDTVKRKEFERRLLAAERAEMAMNLPEYLDHESDLRVALDAARRPQSP